MLSLPSLKIIPVFHSQSEKIKVFFFFSCDLRSYLTYIIYILSLKEQILEEVEKGKTTNKYVFGAYNKVTASRCIQL